MTQEIQIDPMRVRTMQIIAFALISGVVAFLVVVLFLTKGKPPREPLMAYFTAASAAVMIVLRLSVPGMVALKQRRRMTAALSLENNEDRQAIVDACVNTYLAGMVIGYAFLEGAAFSNLIAYLQVIQTWSLAVVGVLVASMLLSFPSEGKVASWVQQQLDAMEFEK